jgi:hypothetical protein
MRRTLLVLIATWAPASGAAVVEFEFTGEVEAVNPFFASIVEVGSPLAGVLRYDTATADQDADPTVGRYPGARLEFAIGSYGYASEGSVDVYDTSTFDGFQFQGQTGGAGPIGGLALDQVTLAFPGTPELLESDALPERPPPLDAPALLEPPSFVIGVTPPGSGITYQRARLQTLPEADGAAALLAAGAALVAVARGGGRRGA